MRVKDVEKLVDLAPHKRAEHMLNMGAELKKTQRKPTKTGKLPRALKRESVTESVGAPLIQRLHGMRDQAVVKTTGLRETGLMLRTKGGDVPDMVLTPRARKACAKTAMRRAKSESVNDLAIRQLALGMLDTDPVSRCCAAYAYWQATGNIHAAMPILHKHSKSGEDEDQMVAAHCLAKMNKLRLLRGLYGTAKDDKPHSPIQPVKNSMTIIIHGTFAKDKPWYKPGGDFHDYIKKNVYPDVYDKSDFYFWSGRYALSDSGLRAIWSQAAKKLVSWVKSHPAKTLRIIAHSHGNNVVNMATSQMPSCTLIQLSVPVRAWNLPDLQSVSSGRIFNIHSRIDLVVKIDGGAQDYKGTAVAAAEKRKIIAFKGHSAPHEPKRWKKKNVPKLVRTVC